MNIRKYVGNKDFSNVIHFLINRLPKSNNYYSLFFGSGGLEQSDYTREAFFVCAEKDPDCKDYLFSSTAIIKYNCYKKLIEDNVFTAEDFIFADPPYIFSTRNSGSKYYKFEFDSRSHIEFLNYMISLNCKIMITHPECDLYNENLKGWSKEPFEYRGRNSWIKDCVYTNYNQSDIELLNFDALGEDFTDRQRIKRQRKNIVNKFINLDPLIRKAVIRDLKKEGII